MKIVKIGRSRLNDVVIDNPSVDEMHCYIIFDDNGKYSLINSSVNGTFVNGLNINREVALGENDIVRVGDVVLPWKSYFCNAPAPAPDPDPEEKPSNFLVWAILSAVFCCVPFSIPSIVNAAKVDFLWNNGRYDEAYSALSRAKTWFWVSFAIGIIFWILYFAGLFSEILLYDDSYYYDDFYY